MESRLFDMCRPTHLSRHGDWLSTLAPTNEGVCEHKVTLTDTLTI